MHLMRTGFGGLMTAAAMAGIFLLGAQPTPAQGTYRAPRAADGIHPDLNGIWEALNTANWDLQDHSPQAGPMWEMGAIGAQPAGQSVVEGAAIPYLPAALEKRTQNFANRRTNDPEAKCYMPGIPRANYMPYPFQIVQSPKGILFVYEYASANRFVNMGKPQEAGSDTWMGTNNGHWEGETLVVDVTRLTDETWMGDNGLLHSRKLHVTERLRRTGDAIQYQVTADDPEVLQKPWTLSRTLTLQPDALEEAAPCIDKDAGHYVTLEHHDNTR